MKTGLFCLLVAGALMAPNLCRAEAPAEIGGFALGKDIAEFKDRVNMDTALPVRYSEYIEEVEIRDTAGFKSGIIGYGTCDEPGKIVRIKLKYADSSKGFYEKLLALFKQRWGEPDEWRGDPFHIMLAWKWSFTDARGDPISLILQHNTKDEQEKMGNAVKLTSWGQFERERTCFEDKFPDFRKASKNKGENKRRGKVDWERFIPR